MYCVCFLQRELVGQMHGDLQDLQQESSSEDEAPDDVKTTPQQDKKGLVIILYLSMCWANVSLV
jgi:hypothetical protein